MLFSTFVLVVSLFYLSLVKYSSLEKERVCVVCFRYVFFLKWPMLRGTVFS